MYFFLTKAEKLIQTHSDFGRFIGKEINKFNKKHTFHPDLIASHGHTVFHQPEKGFTLQIGNGAEIAALTGVKTICDYEVTGDIMTLTVREEESEEFYKTFRKEMGKRFQIDVFFHVNRPKWPSDGLYWAYIGPGLRKQHLGNILEWWLMGEHLKKTCYIK